MSTTVTYKGATLTTVDNATVTLETAGKYCEDDFTLTDVSGGGGGGSIKITISPAPYAVTALRGYTEYYYDNGNGYVEVPIGEIIQWDEMMGGTTAILYANDAPNTIYNWACTPLAQGPVTTYRMIVPNVDCTVTIT